METLNDQNFRKSRIPVSVSNGAKIKVLLVDDSCAFLEATIKTLGRHKEIEITDIAFSAPDALQVLIKHNPDVILLDVEMPERSGIDVLPEIKSKSPCTKVIILTLFDNAEYRSMAGEAGADGFVAKSHIVRELYSTILEVL